MVLGQTESNLTEKTAPAQFEWIPNVLDWRQSS